VSIHNALDQAFSRCRAESRAALIPYLTAGFPDRDRFVELTLATLEAGADAFEIGIPFSDPLLDGVAIQYAQQQALEAGVTPELCLAFAREIHASSDKPLLFMTAFNPLLAFGLDGFCREAAAAGITGLIVPDLPLEEQDELLDLARRRSIHLIQMLAPTSTDERVQQVARFATGFVYCISVAGVTGTRASVAETARPLVERVRATGSDIPVAVGFGISGPESAREVAEFADGVAVGSRFVNLLRDTSPGEHKDALRAFVTDMRAALATAEAVT
jgi:tryptophan synthase alpha chain